MAYAPIAKLEKFTSEENNAQAWLNDVAKAIMANNWNNDRAFQAIPYFFQDTADLELIQNTNLPTNHNFVSIITKINKEIEHYTQQRYPITYTSKGKGKLQTPAVTPKRIQPPTWKKTRVESPIAPSYHYMPRSTINITSANVFISTKMLLAKIAFQMAQILNQFIRGLCNSILQYVRSLHPADLQVTITNTRDFEAAKLEANHTQAINLVMNKSSELDSRLKQFSDSINQKLEAYLADN
ncbi:hypothetical protein G9A89_014976 [Geosiphon pyriformis]|nr:hypothetical protein G9A89_014976 [Geosiphon pyriformis]